MDKKLVGIIIVLMSMVAVLVYFLVKDYWDQAWLIFVIDGFAVAAVSMIGAYTRDKKEEKSEKGGNE